MVTILLTDRTHRVSSQNNPHWMTKYMLNLAKSKGTCHFKTFLLLPLFLVVVRGCVKAMWVAKVSKRERKTVYIRDGGGEGEIKPNFHSVTDL